MGGKVRKSGEIASKTRRLAPAGKKASRGGGAPRKPRGASRAGGKGASRTGAKGASRRYTGASPELFEPLTEGERADARRILVEDRRLANMATVGRYRVIAAEPLVVKPPNPLTGRRLARTVVYDYASDRCIEAIVDLDGAEVAHLRMTRSQPMLAADEEAQAIAVALADDRVKEELALGERAQAAMHYWSWRRSDLAYSRRSAAVIFGLDDAPPSLIAVVDLLDNQVTELVPGAHW